MLSSDWMILTILMSDWLTRMETERMGTSGERKKAAKGKGIRGSSKSGGKSRASGFWLRQELKQS